MSEYAAVAGTEGIKPIPSVPGTGWVMFLALTVLLAAGCAGARQEAERVSDGFAAGLPSDPVAVIGKDGKTPAVLITRKELDAASQDEIKRLEQETYDIKRRRLDVLVNEALWTLAAEDRHMSAAALKSQVLGDAEKGITESEMRSLYARAGNRFGGTYEKAEPALRKFLAGGQERLLEQRFLDDIRLAYGVRIDYEPPRFSVPVDSRLIRGNRKAPVTIVEFSDFECPFCGRVQPTMQQLRREYPDEVRFAFKHFPLSFHQNAQPAHLASLCAEEQGRFWEYRDLLFSKQKELAESDLIRHAEGLGLEMEPFRSCLRDEKYAGRISEDILEGSELGVTGTPAFFINGRMLPGAQPYDSFKRIIDEELAR